MHLRRAAAAALLPILLAACAADPAPGPTAPPAPAPAPAPAVPLAWEDGSPERAAWSATLRAALADHLPAFEAARDGPAFCPAWDGLGPEARIEALAALAVGVARYESGHRAEAIARGRRDRWVGLFQLSARGFSTCASETGGPLTDPATNIRCAVPAMARLAAADAVLAENRRGIARWWTVLRPGGRGTLERIRAEVRESPACRG